MSEEQLSSLYSRIRKRKGKLLILPVIQEGASPPDYLSPLKKKADENGSGLRLIYRQDARNALEGTVAAIRSTTEFGRAREVVIIAPSDWQRGEMQSFLERLQFSDAESTYFRPSRFTIRKKLLLITGMIVLLALSSMIAMASYLFRDHSETLIQGYNLSLARLVAESLENDILGIQYRSLALLDRISTESPTLDTDAPLNRSPESRRSTEADRAPETEQSPPADPQPDGSDDPGSEDEDTAPASRVEQDEGRSSTSATEQDEGRSSISGTEQDEGQASTSATEQDESAEPGGKAKEQEINERAPTLQTGPGHAGFVSARTFFQENKRYLYIGKLNASGEKRELNLELYNGPFFLEYGLTPEQFRQSLQNWSTDALTSGELQINSFKAGDVPVLGFSFPGKDGRLIVYLAADDFFQSFRKARQAGLFEIHLISAQGKVLVSSDKSETELQGHSILQELVSSPLNNGSRKYTNQGKEYLASFQALEGSALTVLSHAEADRVFEAVRRIERQNLYLMGAVLASAFLLVFLFARTLSVPIVRLARATGAVGQGDYTVRIHPSTRDEIGQLTHSFLQMTRGLQERERIKEAFGKFVSPDIAERALRGEIKLGGERKTGTVFFSDLRNFTALSEKRQPEEVVDFLNRYFTVMVDCIQTTGGMVDKFIGDAIMAHWGTLDSSESDTADAVRAALLMRKALMELNQDFVSEGVPTLRFGCGINTGPVIAGQIGSEKRLEYTVIGDTVNLASRIEYLNKLFGTDILISSYSMERVKGQFKAVEMPALRIKGKSEPETVYAILGASDDPTCPADLVQLRSIVGIEFDEKMAAEELKRSSDQMVNSGEKQ